MKSIPRDVIDQLKDYATIEDVCRRLNFNMHGDCPSGHDSEKHNCFHVHTDKGYGKCFHCGNTWDAIGLVREVQGFEFTDALKWMADNFAPHLSDQLEQPPAPNPARDAFLQKAALYEAIVDYGKGKLYGTAGRQALQYLVSRGYTVDTLKETEWFFFPPDRQIRKYLAEHFPEQKDLIYGKNEKNRRLLKLSGFYGDNFRLAFPYRNRYGNITGLVKRALVPEGITIEKHFDGKTYEHVRYDSVFHTDGSYYKKHDLFGLNAVNKEDTVVIVEGYPDAIYFRASGITNIVAVGQGLLAESHLEGLRAKKIKNLIIAFDNDPPRFDEKAGRAVSTGSENTKHAIDLLRQHAPEINAFILDPQWLGEHKDPDELVKGEGMGFFKNLLFEAESDGHPYKWVAQYLLSKYDLGHDKQQMQALQEITETARQLTGLDRSTFLTTISELSEFPIEMLEEEARGLQPLPKSQTPEQPPHPAGENSREERPDNTQEDHHTIPDWAFWTYEMNRSGIRVVVSASKYVQFLAEKNFRLFMKRREPTIVIEMPEDMVKTTVRGRINTTVKEFVLTHLEAEGFMDVVDFLLVNSKFFTIDVLEFLPEILREKARASIFSECKSHVALNTPLEKENPLISYGDTPVLSAENTLAIVGRQGLGKSGVCELFASLSINPECEPLSPFTYHPQGGITLWVDTERTSNDMIYAMKRIKERTQAWRRDKHLLNEDQSEFLNLRVERCGAVEDKMVWMLELLDSIKEPIDLLILDGALDMVKSMNDETQATDFFSDIKAITEKKQCGVIMTIHSAPSDENGKGMGHIGSIIMRKCSSFLQIRTSTDDKSIKELSTDFYHAKMRHGKDWGIYAALQWSEHDNMLHFIDHDPNEDTKASLMNQIRETLEWVFKDGNPIPEDALVSAYLKHYSKDISRRTGQRHIKLAKDAGIIELINGSYHLAVEMI